MKKTILCLLVMSFVLHLSGVLFADVHVKTQGNRLYMDFETKYAYELWLTENKSYSKVQNRITITREDLGVMWFLYPDRKAYHEYKLEEIRAVPEEKEDIHTAGQFYDPKYDWELTDTGEEKEINSFQCRCFLAEGDADFSEIVSKYWICVDEHVAGGKEFRSYMMEQLKDDPQRAKLYDLMKEHPSGFPAYREEIIERAISPTISYTIQVLMLEEEDAPAGIYDLPEGYKKLER